jgi:hypothetical protein
VGETILAGRWSCIEGIRCESGAAPQRYVGTTAVTEAPHALLGPALSQTVLGSDGR